MARAGIEVNRNRLADICGVAEITTDSWRKAGLPAKKNGRSVLFNTKEVIAWLLDRERTAMVQDSEGLPIEQVRLRAETARMHLLELDLALQEKDAVSISDFKEVHEDLVLMIRERLMAFPWQLGADLAHAVINAGGAELDDGEAFEAARIAAETKVDEAIGELLDELTKAADGTKYDIPEDEEEKEDK